MRKPGVTRFEQGNESVPGRFRVHAGLAGDVQLAEQQANQRRSVHFEHDISRVRHALSELHDAAPDLETDGQPELFSKLSLIARQRLEPLQTGNQTPVLVHYPIARSN